MVTHHRIIQGDCRNMAEIAKHSVDLIITSPPYWQLKDYGCDNQIGFHESYESYINNLNIVWNECFRVLRDGCRLCINIGDQFARSVYYGRYKVIPIREEIIKFCEAIGFDYMGAIIWQKVTTTHTTGGGVQMGSYPYPRNGVVKLDYEFILIFKKLGESPKPTLTQKEQSKMTPTEWNTYFAGHWNFAGAKQKSHIAAFPEELPKRLIKMFSFVGETVLDPFAGSGTTNVVAKNLLRHSIGYEIHPEYVQIIRERIGDKQLNMEESTINIIQQSATVNDFEALIEKHPYIFQDPHKIDKKIDIKKLPFGSKIDKESPSQRQELFTVKEIINVEKILLNNNLTIKLIGIKENREKADRALLFLKNLTKGKRVFLKYDKVKFDQENNLLAYLYLENKTFINAHLVKNGLVGVESNFSYKNKDKFLLLMERNLG